MTDDFRRIEAAAMRAWPALETFEEGDWVLRFARGYTKRANSVTVLGGAEPQVDRVERCERWFAARGQPPSFRLLSCAESSGLDALLAARGYRRIDESLVMTLDLRSASLPGPGRLQAEPLDAWLDLFGALSDRAGPDRATHRELLGAIQGQSLLAVAPGPSGAIGCGLGVVDGDLFGLFDLVVAASSRGRGHGARLTTELLAWGRERGATTAYLQVMAANGVARRLYERLGYREAYRYWYRVAPRAASSVRGDHTDRVSPG